MPYFIVPQTIVATVLGTERRMGSRSSGCREEVFPTMAAIIPLLQEVKIPRWLKGMSERVLSCSLHTFCDASKTSYAAAVFARY